MEKLSEEEDWRPKKVGVPSILPQVIIGLSSGLIYDL